MFHIVCIFSKKKLYNNSLNILAVPRLSLPLGLVFDPLKAERDGYFEISVYGVKLIPKNW